MADPGASPPEFSRPIELARIGTAETAHEISATQAEREALTQRFGLLGLARLEARVRVRRTHAGTQVHLAGHLSADVTQACVVTLEPVDNRVEEDFTLVYGEVAKDADVSVDVDEESVVEPLPVGSLDIGEAVAQELALALDPYPHAPGAAVESGAGAGPAPADRPNPFSVLANLRKTKG
ncbi:MAG TPA: DUF177 domain-containing protein [Alphaproteobacteria bacterium]|nr:DUF177 domain-containing protein [Alphaproteobacteria bacterium]